MSPKAVSNPLHPLDIALGGRIRLRRVALGLSQTQLAQVVDVTFQQIQKYEHGTNRVSFSRLMQIATALRCSITDLTDGLDKKATSLAVAEKLALLNKPGALELLDAYSSIRSLQWRYTILAAVKQIAELDRPVL